MEKKEMKSYKKETISAKLKDFCIFSMGEKEREETDFMEVTKWINGEGYDIFFESGHDQQMFSLTSGQYDCLKKIIKKFRKK